MTHTWNSAPWSLGLGLPREPPGIELLGKSLPGDQRSTGARGPEGQRVSQEQWRNHHRPWSLEASAYPSNHLDIPSLIFFHGTLIPTWAPLRRSWIMASALTWLDMVLIKTSAKVKVRTVH